MKQKGCHSLKKEGHCHCEVHRHSYKEGEGHSHPYSHTKDDDKAEKVAVTPMAIHTATRKPQALPTRVIGMVIGMKSATEGAATFHQLCGKLSPCTRRHVWLSPCSEQCHSMDRQGLKDPARRWTCLTSLYSPCFQLSCFKPTTYFKRSFTYLMLLKANNSKRCPAHATQGQEHFWEHSQPGPSRSTTNCRDEGIFSPKGCPVPRAPVPHP